MKHEYRDLRIWQDARKVNKRVYEMSGEFPSAEKYGLTSQIRRASISIASNISEGSSHRSNAMFMKYLDHALGSLCEVETQSYLALDISYISENALNEMISETDKLKRMIISFMNKLRE